MTVDPGTGPIPETGPVAELHAVTFEAADLYDLPGVEALLVSGGRWVGGIEAVWPPRLHANLAFTVGRFFGWLVQIVATMTVDRVVLVPESEPDGAADYSWDYPRRGAAVLAVATWDPQLCGEPAGYVKRGTAHARPAGEVSLR